MIVSRKDQSNKKKLSPHTNHRNTKKGVITGGLNRKNLFQQAEQGFDRLFGCSRQLSETYEYCITMKNGSITDKLQMQEQELNTPEQDFAGKKKKEKKEKEEKEDLQIGRYADKQAEITENEFAYKQNSNSIDLGLSSVFSILPLASDVNPMDEQQLSKPKKKKKRGKKILKDCHSFGCHFLFCIFAN